MKLLSVIFIFVVVSVNAQQQFTYTGIASGTNAYTTNITNLRSYSGGGRGVVLHITFTNANTGSSTLQVGLLAVVDIAGTSSAGTITANSTKTLAYNVTSGDFDIVGGGSGGVGISDGDKGDITVGSSGTVWTIDNLSVDNANVSTGIDAVKLADGSVTNTELQYIGTLSSNAQTQIDGKQAAYGTQTATHVLAGPTPSFRALAAEDLSTLTTSRTITSADDLDQTDNLRKVYVNSATPFNLTVDLLTSGSEVTVINIGSATVTLIEGTGVTLPGTTVEIDPGETAIIDYRVAATPEVYYRTGGTKTIPLALTATNWVDNTTYYMGMQPMPATTSVTIRKMYVRVPSVIKEVEILTQSTTAGSGENWSWYVRVNGTTDYLIQTIALSTGERVITNSNLNISLSANDYFEIKIVCPIFATEPAGTTGGGYVQLEY